MAQSSIKAKYMVVVTTLQEIMWLQTLLNKLGYGILLLNTIDYDNIFCNIITRNLSFYDWKNYIDIKYYYI